MTGKNAYATKFIWGSRDFEDELRKISERIRKERGFSIQTSALTYQLAHDLRSGNIVLNINEIRFKKRRMINIGDKKINTQ